ncbi:MAG TPA: D-aminoacyl-tRNA deacylase [Nitrososphaera sp.]
MKFILVASSQDLAGRTLSSCLLSEKGFVPDGLHDGRAGRSFSSPAHRDALLYVADASLLTLETLDGTFPDAGAYVFLSKHRSDSEIPTLTCHCTGNFADAPFGGNPKEIAMALPSLQKAYLQAITRAGARGYDVIIEATHHGPTSLKKPVLFVELGSSEKQWADASAARAMCDALLQSLDFTPCKKVGVAIGGTHYPTKFNKLLLESEFGLAAVASKHALAAIDEPMLAQMIKKSAEKVTHVILDAKGLGSHKERITKMAESTGLSILKV